jgi:hypothetical protein
VTSGDDLRSALERTDGKPSLLVVNRKGAEFFVTLKAQ